MACMYVHVDLIVYEVVDMCTDRAMGTEYGGMYSVHTSIGSVGRYLGTYIHTPLGPSRVSFAQSVHASAIRLSLAGPSSTLSVGASIRELVPSTDDVQSHA
jgi:hypothetical protein